MTWKVYIIETISGKLYTGITTDLERRFKEHSSSNKKRAKFFSFNPPKRVVYQENVKDRSSATKKEIEIKKLTKKEKLNLIALSSNE
ncbi:GIY-YIG nuclease family protein [Pigmentibacter sp. JX0631]|uniref:GIY-YIG nuclease family protein n=1 Tax=Pigmentibacter sp. JX0631 TaxID=2976982 RepID=UPI002469BAA7|nr:GIY-YIG nuclease family protein [Pigmentibacter sp. JX0631]WGL59713.1 GIY-YIG nuclease family protein [Pigmentibacter sp. JX0631]